jgi:hypothetical protein
MPAATGGPPIYDHPRNDEVEKREELWRRYKAGETVLGIANALGHRTTNLYRVLQASGGIAPAQRSRAPRDQIALLNLLYDLEQIALLHITIDERLVYAV